MAEIIEKDLSYQIVQAGYTVFNELGPGFDEDIYENAMVVVLTRDNHTVE
jgi:GxxExxY protein